ncbi:MAG: RidA family protein [Alphaproteobacteria bacterium]|nr:MAG: RidA family protein [Alphaproteobacteria bacterium]
MPQAGDIIEAKLKSLGVVLPQPAAPVASYVPFVVINDMVYISGQLPMQDGKIAFQGKVGKDFTVEQAAEAAKLCAINILAQIKTACRGDWGRIERCVKLTGFVNCIDGFADQPKVINGASNLMVDVLGDIGKHARAAVGVNALPLNAAVEVEAIFTLTPSRAQSNDY